MLNHYLAQLSNPVLPPSLGGAGNSGYNQGTTAIGMLLSNIIGGIFVFAFILAFIFLLVGGISWITAGGEKGKLEEARNKITHAIVGLIIVAAGYAIMILVGQFLGLTLQKITLPTF